MTVEERMEAMVRRLGETTTKAAAAREIHVTPNTITRMLDDGRLEPVCAGRRVDTRSLARYIETPAEVKEQCRKMRIIEKYNLDPRWVV